VELGQSFGAEKGRAPLSDRGQPMTLLSIIGARWRPNSEGVKKQNENAGIEG
jgi:hypothetical protein